jgi:DNA helicase-2/ATP-dependent DNA helicase PcrA
MRVAVREGDSLLCEPIRTIERVDARFIDLDVGDASNFFGGGILSHNSIYAFRGAKPENYVNLSKSGDFQTLLMTKNFRSGSVIVEAANKLIAHNGDRQIPMTCQSHEPRGEGSVHTVTPATHEDGAVQVAAEIAASVAAGDSPSDFGILVRNNAEADAYSLSLITNGIPYRLLKAGNKSYFDKPVVKALMAWMRLVIGGSTSAMNDAFTVAHQTPGFGLDKAFAANLALVARGGDFYDHCASGGPVYTGQTAWRNKFVTAYVDAIQQLKSLGVADNSEALVKTILELKGPHGSFIDALMKQVDEEDVLQDNPEGGQDAIRAAALAPVRPLMLMAAKFLDPNTMMDFVAKMRAANEKVQKKSPGEAADWKEPAVLIGTVHGWKGLQAKHVYAVLAGGVFPSFHTEKAFDETGDDTVFDEERRLAYVAITRGQDSVVVVSPAQNYHGKPAGQSRFIGEACLRVTGEETPATPVEDGIVRTAHVASGPTAAEEWITAAYEGVDEDDFDNGLDY